MEFNHRIDCHVRCLGWTDDEMVVRGCGGVEGDVRFCTWA